MADPTVSILSIVVMRYVTFVGVLFSSRRRHTILQGNCSSDVCSSDLYCLICGAAGFFFFQAEDGIRDVAVTGVQTCALPISINRALVDSMDRLTTRKNQLSIVHQTGERDYDAVRTAYARREILAEVVPFIMNMPERFGWADIIVCRAGAITAAEVAAAGRAGIFIPFGRATEIGRASCRGRV